MKPSTSWICLADEKPPVDEMVQWTTKRLVDSGVDNTITARVVDMGDFVRSDQIYWRYLTPPKLYPYRRVKP